MEILFGSAEKKGAFPVKAPFSQISPSGPFPSRKKRKHTAKRGEFCRKGSEDTTIPINQPPFCKAAACDLF